MSRKNSIVLPVIQLIVMTISIVVLSWAVYEMIKIHYEITDLTRILKERTIAETFNDSYSISEIRNNISTIKPKIFGTIVNKDCFGLRDGLQYVKFNETDFICECVNGHTIGHGANLTSCNSND